MKFEKKKIDPVMISIGGVEYPAKLTNRAMIELEEITGEVYTALFTRIETLTATLKDLQIILYVALKGGGVELTLEDMLDSEYTYDDFGSTIGSLTELINRAFGISTDLDVDGVKEKKTAKNKTPRKPKPVKSTGFTTSTLQPLG